MLTKKSNQNNSWRIKSSSELGSSPKPLEADNPDRQDYKCLESQKETGKIIINLHRLLLTKCLIA